MPMPPTSSLITRGRRHWDGLRSFMQRGSARRNEMRRRHQSSPSFRTALSADVAANLMYRGESPGELTAVGVAAEAFRLSIASDAFLAQMLYRGRASMIKHGVPVLPRVCHFLSMSMSQVCIGDPVIIKPGLYLPHGQVVVDGLTQVGSGAILFPWTTIGLRAGSFAGPTLGDDVHVGTGAKVVGSVTVGNSTRIGANAVVIHDAAPHSTMVGVPALPTSSVRQ